MAISVAESRPTLGAGLGGGRETRMRMESSVDAPSTSQNKSNRVASTQSIRSIQNKANRRTMGCDRGSRVRGDCRLYEALWGGYVSGGPVAETGENSGRGRRMNVLNSVDEPKNGEQWKWWDGRKVGGLRWFHLRESELGR